MGLFAGNRSSTGTDVTGKSVPQGERLGVQIQTNMYAATYANRNNTIGNLTGIGAEVTYPGIIRRKHIALEPEHHVTRQCFYDTYRHYSPGSRQPYLDCYQLTLWLTL